MTKLRSSIYLLLTSLCLQGLGQTTAPKYWIAFTDKLHTPYSVDAPQEFLSPRALERRSRQGISVGENDLPVDPVYVDSLKKLGITIINISKWMNGVVAQSSDSLLIDTLNKLAFIAAPPKVIEPEQPVPVQSFIDKFSRCQQKASIDYGASEIQVKMLNGEYLHEKGYQGKGMLIAVEDAGFTNAHAISSLQHLYNNGQIVAARDFVKNGTELYSAHPHGTYILSIMGGYLPDTLRGTAVDAYFALIRTENAATEYVIEEYNWVCGAEFADSLGADVINSSLGYSLFDDPAEDHTYRDMDGKTAVSTIGADIAVSKGMVVLVSAGNEGSLPWQKITSHSDGFNVICVGAVDQNERITNFSSLGPSFDGRVKPDVCAMGLLTASQSPGGSISGCSGTSCSCPVLSGMTACLWEANPSATSLQVIRAIRQSGSQYDAPDTVYGYGIPDFGVADHLLKKIIEVDAGKVDDVTLYPNPVQSLLTLEVVRPADNVSRQTATITFYDLMGGEIHSEERVLEGEINKLVFDNIGWMPAGVCLARIKIGSRSFTLRVIKLP